jgi:hypothetical protein
VLIIGESCIGAFLLILLLQFYPWYYLALSFYSYNCWVPTISVLILAIFPCYSNLRLRRRGWTGILRWGVLGCLLPQLSFLWCYGVFRYSVPLRVIIVFRDTVFVIIIILYSWHLVICEHFWPYVWNNWSWVMHMMSTWFWHKNQVWHHVRYNAAHDREDGSYNSFTLCRGCTHSPWVVIILGKPNTRTDKHPYTLLRCVLGKSLQGCSMVSSSL